MKTELKTAPVACFCCRKARGVLMVTDNGFKTYPVCLGCRRRMILVVRETPIAR